MRSVRVLLATFVVVGATALSGGAAVTDTCASVAPNGVLSKAACCKVCRVGKACGNSCISRKYRCHKGRGCACNARP